MKKKSITCIHKTHNIHSNQLFKPLPQSFYVAQKSYGVQHRADY